LLEQDPNIRPTPVLYPFERNVVYSNILKRLAQNLPNGNPSPFLDENPLSAEGILMANIVYLQELMANEINLIPDNIFYTFYRTLGLLPFNAEYPILEIELTVSDPLPVPVLSIPSGTLFRSRINPNSFIVTRDIADFYQGDVATKIITARYSNYTLLDNITENEFSVIPQNLTYLNTVKVTSLLSQGKAEESLSDLMFRARERIRKPGNRAVTARDYRDLALESGATKVALFPRLRLDVVNNDSFYDDLISLAVYPSSAVSTVNSALSASVPYGTRLSIVSAPVILLEGSITLVVSSQYPLNTAYALAAEAIVSSINPPNGKWGTKTLVYEIIDAIKRNGLDPNTRKTIVFDVVDIRLTQVGTAIAYEVLDIQPWHLFEIQNSIVFNYRQV